MKYPREGIPFVRLLGPAVAENLVDEDSMPGRGVELMAYLLLNGTVKGTQLQRDFWPDTVNASNNQRGLAKKVRVALGHKPDGTRWFPENENHQGYRLDAEIRTDWDVFQELIGDDLERTSNADLVAALRLVRGTPFAGCDKRRWWQWIAIPYEEMIRGIMDAADELARRALLAYDRDQARYAAHVAQAVEPLNEAGWRTEIRAAIQSADVNEYNRVVTDLYVRVGGADPDYELDEETQELVDQAESVLTR